MTTAGKYSLSATAHLRDERNPLERKVQRAAAYIAMHRLAECAWGPGADGSHPSPVARRLWCTLTDQLLARAESYDPIFADAVWRWVQATCTTTASRATYVKAMLDWSHWCGPGLRSGASFDRECETDAIGLAAYLRDLGDRRGLSMRTVVQRRNILRSWFQWLLDLGFIERLPLNREALRVWRIRHERIERGDGTRQALTLAEGQKLATWALTQARPIEGLAALLQAVSGLRSHEVAAAESRHLTFSLMGGIETGRLVVQGKGGRQRVVTLEPVVCAAWWRYRPIGTRSATRGPLLVIGRHAPAARTVQTWAKKGLRAAGRPELSSHDLRRTATTLLIDAGATLEQAQRLLGHASMAMTQRCYVARPKPLSVTTGITVPQAPA